MKVKSAFICVFAGLACALASAALGEPGRKVRVACIGDSITWGYVMTNRTQESYRPRYIIWTKLGLIGKIHRLKGKEQPFLIEHDLKAVAKAVGAEGFDMYTPLLPFAETAHFAKDGIHPEGGAQRVIAEITARQILGKRGSCR